MQNSPHGSPLHGQPPAASVYFEEIPDFAHTRRGPGSPLGILILLPSANGPSQNDLTTFGLHRDPLRLNNRAALESCFDLCLDLCWLHLRFEDDLVVDSRDPR